MNEDPTIHGPTAAESGVVESEDVVVHVVLPRLMGHQLKELAKMQRVTASNLDWPARASPCVFVVVVVSQEHTGQPLRAASGGVMMRGGRAMASTGQVGRGVGR